jgi:hypothetical protein
MMRKQQPSAIANVYGELSAERVREMPPMLLARVDDVIA